MYINKYLLAFANIEFLTHQSVHSKLLAKDDIIFCLSRIEVTLAFRVLAVLIRHKKCS